MVKTASKAKTAKLPPFDPELFGQILTDPPKLFPHDPSINGRPWPDTPDPFGSGQAVIDFLNQFRIAEGRALGKKIGDNLAPHVEAALRTIFGHRDPKTWTRYTRSFFFTAPRKSMKTYMAALIGIVFLYSTQEPGNSIIITATASRQSRRTFDMIVAILRTNKDLMRQLKIQDFQMTITHKATGTTLVATPSQPDKLWGLSPGVILADEAHAWRGPKGQKLWNSLATGQGARPNPLWAIFSTVPDDPPAPNDIYSEQVAYGNRVIDGEVEDNRHIPAMWIADEDADIDDREVWKAVNPGLGTSIDMEELEEAYAKAEQSDAGMQGFRAMRLNQIPASSLDKGWLSPKMIERLDRTPFTIDDMAEAPFRAVGVDMGGVHDLLSIAAVAVDDDGRTMIMQQSFASQALVEEFAGSTAINRWIERGEVEVAGDGAVPVNLVADAIMDWCNALDVQEVALDPAYTVSLAVSMEPMGIELRAARQGAMTMAPVVHGMEQVISDGNMVIGESELLLQAFRNTANVSNSVGQRLAKLGADDARNPRKMDPVAATATAWQLIVEQQLGGDSEYVKDRGDVLVICPFEDAVNAEAVLQGYDAMGHMHEIYFDHNMKGWVIL